MASILSRPQWVNSWHMYIYRDVHNSRHIQHLVQIYRATRPRIYKTSTLLFWRFGALVTSGVVTLTTPMIYMG